MSIKYITLWFYLLSINISANYVQAATNHKTLLVINSYHPGYEWSDGMMSGVREAIAQSNVKLETFYMDSKRHRSLEYIMDIAKQTHEKIQQLRPDIVIAMDDNAVKYVIAPYYKNTNLPVVFCGVNWDASVYGLPVSNVTGMEEIALISPIVQHLKKFSKGKRLGLISIDALSGRRNVNYFSKQLQYEFDKVYYVSHYKQWQQAYRQLQQEVDMLILENPKGITGWDNTKAKAFIEAETMIPTGTTHVWLAPYALITIAKVPQEQGYWAANQALKILAGQQVSTIPVTQNKQGKLFINLKLGHKLNVIFSPALIEMATIIH